MANEKRLIDANALLEYFQFRLPIDNQNAEVIDGCVKIARRTIENAPTVDAVEVVHGRWVMTLYTTTSKSGRVIANKKFACSVCGYGNGRKRSNYCPNCGAKMDGDGNV